MQGDQVAHDTQAKPGATRDPCRAAVHLSESFEYRVAMLRSDAGAAVGDLDHQVVAVSASGTADPALVRGEFEGVRQQVQHNAPQMGRIDDGLDQIRSINDELDTAVGG